MRKALTLLYLAAVPLLAAAAAYILQMRCEGFGCMGVGVAWVVWLMAYGVTLFLGVVLVAAPTPQGRLQPFTRWGLALQLALGVVAVALWVAKHRF